MKRLLSIIAFTLTVSAFSQEQEVANSNRKNFDDDLRRANTYYNRAFYAKAIKLYEKVSLKNRDNTVIENLANCYYNIGDLKQSARLYGYLVNRDSQNKTYENLFKYVQALKASDNYEDANSVMREYLVEKDTPEAVSIFDDEVKKQENIIAIGERCKLKNLEINTENSEFGTKPYDDFLVFAATEKDPIKRFFRRSYAWNQQHYLDLYKIHNDSISHGNEYALPLSKQVNTKLHEGAVAFTKDGKTMYFTRNNYNKRKEVKDENRITNLKIYKAQFIDGDWANIEELPFNSDAFSIEHPALSPDDNRLYFSSDMPGTLGSFDLFYVDINGDGSYSAPKNLGSKINTIHREQFPFISEEGDLYFSSNGQFGFGGLDIYISKLENNTFTVPDNLGFPINSGHDDFAYYYEDSSNTGYLSSNRLGGKGSDDIYSFNDLKPLIIKDCQQFIAGVISDKNTKAPIQNARVALYQVLENTKKDITAYGTNEAGEFNHDSACEMTVLVKATADGYQEAERTIIINKDRGIVNDASLELVSLASIKAKEEAEKLQEIEDKKQQAEKEKQIAKAKKQKEIQTILDTEPNIKEERGNLVIELEQIHFDYKLWYIRSDVKKILKRVIDLMKKYPNMRIEIGSHTDIRGNKAYNKDLSQKRALSTKEYISSRGIDADRIVAKGYGESQPIKACKTEDSCSEEEHEINRRSEFVIKQIF